MCNRQCWEYYNWIVKCNLNDELLHYAMWCHQAEKWFRSNKAPGSSIWQVDCTFILLLVAVHYCYTIQTISRVIVVQRPGYFDLFPISVSFWTGRFPALLQWTHPCTNRPHGCMTHLHNTHRDLHIHTNRPSWACLHASLQHRWLNSGCLPALRAPPLLLLYFTLSHFPPPPLKAKLDPPKAALSLITLLSPSSPLTAFTHCLTHCCLASLPSTAGAKWPDRFGSIHHCNHAS